MATRVVELLRQSAKYRITIGLMVVISGRGIHISVISSVLIGGRGRCQATTASTSKQSRNSRCSMSMAMAMATVLSQNVGGGDSACTKSSGGWTGGRAVGDHVINLLSGHVFLTAIVVELEAGAISLPHIKMPPHFFECVVVMLWRCVVT